MALAEATYALTARFPPPERFALAQQIRRAAVSIPSNIAEGHARRSRPAFLYFLRVALGSEAELATQVALAIRLGFVTPSDAAPTLATAAEVGKMINGLIRSLTPTLTPTPDP